MKRLLVIFAILIGFSMAGSTADAGYWRRVDRRAYRQAYYGTPYNGAYYGGGYYGAPYYNSYYRGGVYPNGYYNGYRNGVYVAPAPAATVVTPGGAVGVGVY